MLQVQYDGWKRNARLAKDRRGLVKQLFGATNAD